MKSSFYFLCRCWILTILLLTSNDMCAQKKLPRQCYQLTSYRYTTPVQEAILDHYLQQALLPALHRATIKNIGVFKAIANDTASGKLLFVLVPLRDANQLVHIHHKLATDSAYLQNGAAYLNAPHNEPVYQRIEVQLLQAFEKAPVMNLPQLKAERHNRVYELRSYESASEQLFASKVHMFNEGDEIGLFKRLNFNAVFYSTALAGSHMPNLVYMTSFESMADRDEHWKAFVADDYWKKLVAMPQYQHNMQHMDVYLLRPTTYSDY
ncbi:MAG: hypothetical protein RL172_1261 [Bacteroidota bacterium]|jgi:hypothetical protein